MQAFFVGADARGPTRSVDDGPLQGHGPAQLRQLFLFFRNYSAPSETGAAAIKAGHLPWKSKRKASEAVSPCFRQVDT